VRNPNDDDLSIGPQSKEWLQRVGITSRSDLISVGVDEVYAMVINAGHEENRSFYCGLDAIVLDVPWTEAREILQQNPDLFQD
jgi:TfoX C-terminal domain